MPFLLNVVIIAVIDHCDPDPDLNAFLTITSVLYFLLLLLLFGFN